MTTRIALTIILSALVAFGCSGSRDFTREPLKALTKAPMDSLIERCENIAETQEVKCPLKDFLKALWNYTDIFEFSRKCGARLTACNKFGAVDKAEMQHKINQESSRADRNAKWIWIVAGVGGVLTVVSFLVGAFAL
jgi:hypothetical protein